MAEMMNEDIEGQNIDTTPMDQDYLMPFSMTSGETYGNKDHLYAYQINDYGHYLNSFNSSLPAAEIDSIASNAQQIMGKDLSDIQVVENEITTILKEYPATSMMGHSKLIQFLHNELNKRGFKNLEKVDVLKHASVVRDPITKQSVVPFETRPTTSGEMKNLAWEKIHQEAHGHLTDKNLKLNNVNHNMLIQDVINQNNVDKEYDISRDKDYIHINHNENSAKLYDYIKEKAISTFNQLSHTHHAVVESTKISKDGKNAKVLDLLDSGGDLTLVTKRIKDLIDKTEVRNETFNVVTSAGVGVHQRDKVGYEIQRCNGKPKGITAHMTDTLGKANGYDFLSTKCIVEGFGMPPKLSEYFMGKLHYNAPSINGVMGLKNAAGIMYDIDRTCPLEEEIKQSNIFTQKSINICTG